MGNDNLKDVLNLPSEYKSVGLDSPKLILIAGVAGSGKSTIGRELHRHFNNCLYLDKDTVTRPFAEKLLVALGSNKDDRESNLYLDNVLDTEYDTLMSIAKENLVQYNNVMVNAPFVKQLSDKKWVKFLHNYCESLGVHLVVYWVHASPNTCYNRIIKRSASRDEWKLSNWKQYVDDTPHKAPDSYFKAISIVDNDNDFNDPADIALEVYKELLFR